MDSRKSIRKEITKGVMHDIINQSRLERIVGRMSRKDRTPKDDDSFSDILNRVRDKYHDLTIAEIHTLSSRIYAATDDIPKYNPLVAYGIYHVLTKIVGERLFDTIRITGHLDRVLDLAGKEPIVILPPHFDMLDPAIYSYIFMKHGRDRLTRPPIWHMGINLASNVLDSFLLPRANGFWIKRTHTDNLDRLVYAESMKAFIERSWAQGIFVEATRRRDLKVAPLKPKERYLMDRKIVAEPMKSGSIGSLFQVNQNTSRNIWICEAVHNAPFFPDVLFDYQKELLEGKKKTKFSTMRKLLNSRHYENVDSRSGIYIHFMEPYPLPKSGNRSLNTSGTRKQFLNSIRKTFKENITVLPENIFAYTVRLIDKTMPEYQDLRLEDRKELAEKIYVMLADHLNQDATVLKADVVRQSPGEAFQIGKTFYQDLCKNLRLPSIIDDDMTISDCLLIETSSNRIQHYLKAYPLERKERCRYDLSMLLSHFRK